MGVVASGLGGIGVAVGLGGKAVGLAGSPAAAVVGLRGAASLRGVA